MFPFAMYFLPVRAILGQARGIELPGSGAKGL